MAHEISRRDAIRTTALAAGLAAVGGVWTDTARAQSKSPSAKLQLACVAAGGQGASDIGSLFDTGRVEVVALCDVDDGRAAGTYRRFPNAVRYRDYRRMLEKEGKRIDAVSVSTPDHHHACAAMMAMEMRKHVYVQKPLTRTVSEARALTLAARRYGVVTQMGNQAHPSYWRLVEYMRTGVIGPVTEVHVMTDRPIWPQGMQTPTTVDPVPDTLDWDLWLGPAPKRPFNRAYLPFVWRGWWDYGTGALGDMACHLMDGAFLALDLSHAVSAEAECDKLLPDACPNWSIIHLDFPARGDKPPVTVRWYDGGQTIPAYLLDGTGLGRGFNGSLFVGGKGKMFVPHGGEPVLLPRKQFEGFQPPPETLPRPAGGHYAEWVRACLEGGVCGSAFDYAGPMTESINLGNVSMRVGRRINWDAANMRATNAPEADEFVQHRYRKGWSL